MMTQTSCGYRSASNNMIDSPVKVSFVQETVEVEQEAGEMGGQNMIIILNPNGTVNEELMQAHGINQVRLELEMDLKL